MKLALDIKESSEAIGVGTTNLRRMCREKVIPSYKEGKKIMIPIKALEKWVDKQVKSSP
ncbi:helix-turn-helix domain-containing protein [Gammaproteobacteria bacterium]|nr:helix-turn-helix domain-containing protein [Gammaproteobacteria bacterium]